MSEFLFLPVGDHTMIVAERVDFRYRVETEDGKYHCFAMPPIFRRDPSDITGQKVTVRVRHRVIEDRTYMTAQIRGVIDP